MAKKSKTQKAKASANRAAKKARAIEEQNEPKVVEEEPKKGLLNKKDSAEKPEQKKDTSGHSAPKKDARATKRGFKFLSDVRAELRRVTWPTKQDVLQWTGVVIVALLFFGIFVVVLDDGVVTPILLAISSLGA